MPTADRLCELLAVDQPTERLPLITVSEPRAAVVLLQALGETGSPLAPTARSMAAKPGMRLTAEA